MTAPQRLVRRAGWAAAMLALCGAAAAQDPTERLIVKYRDTGPTSAPSREAPIAGDRMGKLEGRARAFGVNAKLLRHTAQGAHVLELSRKMNIREAEALAAAMRADDPSIEYAEPDYILHASLTPNDPGFSQQWNLHEATAGIRVPKAWDLSTGAGVVVAVVDTGYRPHADLASNIVGGYDFVNATRSNDGDGRDPDARDAGDYSEAGECSATSTAKFSSWHGTMVSGVVAAPADNGLAIAGVAFGAKVLPVRVLGKCGAFTSDLADGVIWASGGAVTGIPANTNPARVINMSLSGSGSCSTTMQGAVDSARSRNSVIVAAAGNSNSSGAFQPASCVGVIAVAATDRFGNKAYYSNFGTAVALAAPGGDMSSATANGIYSTSNLGATTPDVDFEKFVQGTSFAAPQVAGVAALMISRNGSLSADTVKSKLTSTVRAFPGTCSDCGSGLLDAFAAVQSASAVIFNETEPNNARTSPNNLTSSALVKGAIGSTTDTDFFKVDLPAGRTLRATLIADQPTANYDLSVWDGNGNEIGSSSLGAGETDTVSVTNNGSLTYKRTVQVKYVSGPTGSSLGKYVLDIKY